LDLLFFQFSIHKTFFDIFGKSIIGKVMKGNQAAEAERAAAQAAQSVKDAKLKFAQEAVKPGAGLDYKP